MIQVLLVEDEEDWVSIIQGNLRKAEDINLVAAVKCENEMMNVLREQPIDVVLLDLCLEEDMEGVRLAGEVRKVSRAKVVVLTSVSQIDRELYFKDISGYLYKSQMAILCNTIRDVAAGNYPYEEMIQEHKRSLAMTELKSLSERERAILRLLLENKTMVQMGVDQGVSDNTIKQQVSSIYRKLGIKERKKRRERLRERYEDVVEYL